MTTYSNRFTLKNKQLKNSHLHFRPTANSQKPKANGQQPKAYLRHTLYVWTLLP